MKILFVFLPVLGAYLAHAPFLKYNLWPGLAVPIDHGKTFRGKRIFGDHKTWRGFIVMALGVSVTALILYAVPGYRAQLPPEIREAGPWVFAILLGLGFEAGEFPNSFLKRQLGIEPGTQRKSFAGALFVILDQVDFVPGIWLFLAPIRLMTLREGAIVLVAAVAVHMLISVIGYGIGARKTWI